MTEWHERKVGVRTPSKEVLAQEGEVVKYLNYLDASIARDMPTHRKAQTATFQTDGDMTFLESDLAAGFAKARSRGQVVATFRFERPYFDTSFLTRLADVTVNYQRDAEHCLVVTVRSPGEVFTHGIAWVAKNLADNMQIVLDSEPPERVTPPPRTWDQHPVGITLLAVFAGAIATIIGGFVLFQMGWVG